MIDEINTRTGVRRKKNDLNFFFFFELRIEANSSRLSFSSFLRQVRSASIVICYFARIFSLSPPPSYCCCCSLYVIRVCGKLTILTGERELREREPNTKKNCGTFQHQEQQPIPVPTIYQIPKIRNKKNEWLLFLCKKIFSVCFIQNNNNNNEKKGGYCAKMSTHGRWIVDIH